MNAILNLPLRGSAGRSRGRSRVARRGAGHFASIDDGIAAMVRPGWRVEPNPGNVARYAEVYPRYLDLALYPALKETLSA